MAKTEKKFKWRYLFYGIICIIYVLVFLVGGMIFLNIYLSQDKVVNSLGSYSSKQIYTHGEFQDFTDYGKYTFENLMLEDNKYFVPMSEEGREAMLLRINKIEGFIEVIEWSDPQDELVLNYDFDKTLISDDDYLYIYNDSEYSELGNYDVYFLDTETGVLYYSHLNI